MTWNLPQERTLIDCRTMHDSHDDQSAFHAETESLRSLVKAQKETIERLEKEIEFLKALVPPEKLAPPDDGFN